MGDAITRHKIIKNYVSYVTSIYNLAFIEKMNFLFYKNWTHNFILLWLNMIKKNYTMVEHLNPSLAQWDNKKLQISFSSFYFFFVTILFFGRAFVDSVYCLDLKLPFEGKHQLVGFWGHF